MPDWQVAHIKREPLDEADMSDAMKEIQVKSEPDEEEGQVELSQQDEVDLTSNKCNICNYVFSSNNSYVRHLSSRKHIKRTLPPEEALKFETPSHEDNLSEILPDNAVRATRQKNNRSFDAAFTDDSQESYIDDSFFCKICNRTYCSASELKRHNRSMKHMRNSSIRAALKRKANRQLTGEQYSAEIARATMFAAAATTTVTSRLNKDYICPMENCTFASKEGASLLEHMLVHGIRNSNSSVAMIEPAVEINVIEPSRASTPNPQSLQKIYCKCKQIFTNNSEYLSHLKVCRLMTKIPAIQNALYDIPPPPGSQQQQQQEPQQNGGPGKKMCRLCDLTFTSDEVYLNHLQIYHKGSSLEQTLPRMKQPAVVQHSGKLWTQVMSKSGEILYNCIICNKKFKQHFSLNSHLRQHKQPPSRRDVCKICNKVFSNSKFFEKHVRGHFLPPNSRKLFCFKCYKTFDHRGEIIAHRATCNTMKMRLFNCSICKQSFKDMLQLKEHKIRVHTSILPVQALCTVDIKEEPEEEEEEEEEEDEESSALQIHNTATNNATGAAVASPVVENKVCQLCNKSFYNFQNMKRHCFTVHRNEDISFLEYIPFGGYEEATTSANDQQQDKWYCQFCRKELPSERLLIYHIEHQCPYLQHIPDNGVAEKPPPDKPAHYKHRCIICAKFLPAYQNAPDTVCSRCMAKFEGTQTEEANRKYSGQMAGTSYPDDGKTTPPVTPSPTYQPLPAKIGGKFYQCPIGKKLFTTEAWMMKHYKICDGSCPSYINCARCNLNFKSAIMYENHIQKCEAGTIKRFDCSLCGKTYSKRDYVVKHKQFAHKKQVRKQAPPPTQHQQLLAQQLINEDEYYYGAWIEQVNLGTSRRRPSNEHQDEHSMGYDEEDQEDDDRPEINSALLEPTIEIVPSEDGVVETIDDPILKDGQLEDNTMKFPCDGCSRVFDTYKGLSNHSIVHNRSNNSNKESFDCKFCNRTDLAQSQIYSHAYRCIKYLLSLEPVVICKICQRNFNTSLQTKEFSALVIGHVFDCYDIPYYKNEDDGGLNQRLLCYICCTAFTCPDRLRFHKAEHARKSQAKSYTKKTKRKLRVEADLMNNETSEKSYENNTTVNDYNGEEDDEEPAEATAAEVTAAAAAAAAGPNQVGYNSMDEEVVEDLDEQPPRKIFRDENLFRCRICERPFFSIDKLKNHEKVHGIIQKNVYTEDLTAALTAAAEAVTAAAAAAAAASNDCDATAEPASGTDTNSDNNGDDVVAAPPVEEAEAPPPSADPQLAADEAAAPPVDTQTSTS